MMGERVRQFSSAVPHRGLCDEASFKRAFLPTPYFIYAAPFIARGAPPDSHSRHAFPGPHPTPRIRNRNCTRFCRRPSQAAFAPLLSSDPLRAQTSPVRLCPRTTGVANDSPANRLQCD